MHHLARFFIKRPNTIYYGLGNADRTQSYHLQVAGPEGTFCSLAALKYSGPLGASDSKPLGTNAENTKKSSDEEKAREQATLAESVVRPFADMALSQKRCGQRHLWVCVKDGSGFASWSLMYRHTPRLYNAYSISLIAAAVSAAMALICLFDFIHLSAPINFPYNSSSTLPASFLAIVAPIAMAWIAKENRSARGLEIIPLLVIILVAASSLATIYNVFVTSNAAREVLLWCCSLLTACALLLLARIVVWTMIMWRLAEEEQPTENLAAEEDSEGQRRRIELACSWSPGWRVLDCNNHIDKRFNRVKAARKEKQYRQNRRYVRDAFLCLANRRRFRYYSIV